MSTQHANRLIGWIVAATLLPGLGLPRDSAMVVAETQIETVTPTATATMTPATPSEPTIPLTVTPTATETPTPTFTPTPRPVQLPLLYRQLRTVLNGDFETGEFLPGWRDTGSLPRAVTTEQHRHGDHAALLGDPGYDNVGGCPVGEAAIDQVIDVPAQGHSSLRFWYRIQSYDTLQFDYLAVRLALWPEPALPGATPTPVFLTGRIYHDFEFWTSGWQRATIPLDAYRGQAVRFTIYNAMTNEDGWYNTWTYIDDVYLEHEE